MEHRYERKAEDFGNVVGLEHVNVRIPDQEVATLFYVTGLGLTRDPYLMTSTNNMWINIGRSQFLADGQAPGAARSSGHRGAGPGSALAPSRGGAQGAQGHALQGR